MLQLVCKLITQGLLPRRYCTALSSFSGIVTDILLILHDTGQNIQGLVPNVKMISKGCAEGKVCRFKGLMAYRLVSGLAEFNPNYHCINGSLYDSDSYEAISVVSSFDQMKKGEQFHIHPGIVDGLTQSAGFVMNGPVEQVENEWAPSLDATL